MQGSRKERIDTLLVQKGLAGSREKAKRIIMAGLVFVEQQRVDKPGTLIHPTANIEVRGVENPFVSRGGLKLEKALNQFDVPVAGRIWMDIGASTGGFTHCLLNHGADKVYSIDVGYGQLAWELRQDPRVVVMERTNIRNVKQEDIGSPAPNGAVIDVSFISLKLVLPVAAELLSNDSHIVSLIKPQFEVGKGKVGKKGVVREASLHREVLEEILKFAQEIGLIVLSLEFSPITGPEGNIEFLAHLYKGERNTEQADIAALADSTVKNAHEFFSRQVSI
jgi:23S rRNA (cytidine1920-2'-O)/16S rRNA (cytidine1409-2'-O)-methyltransferase